MGKKELLFSPLYLPSLFFFFFIIITIIRLEILDYIPDIITHMNGLQKFTVLTPMNNVNTNEELFIHLEIIIKICKEIVRILS